MKPDNAQVRVKTLVAEFHAYNAEISNTQRRARDMARLEVVGGRPTAPDDDSFRGGPGTRPTTPHCLCDPQRRSGRF